MQPGHMNHTKLQPDALICLLKEMRRWLWLMRRLQGNMTIGLASTLLNNMVRMHRRCRRCLRSHHEGLWKSAGICQYELSNMTQARGVAVLAREEGKLTYSYARRAETDSMPSG